MSEEEKNQQEEEINQEDLAKEWEKMAQQQSEETEHHEETANEEKLAEEWEKMAQQTESEQKEKEEINESEEVNVPQEDIASEWEQALQQESKQPEMESFEKEKLDLLMDIPLEISVEIGSTTMPLEEVLKLNPNSIVELDRYINQPVDIKVNGKLIAKGELYTVENNFGIKITSIITVQERMKLLTDEQF